jgi:hypothetical protein
MRVPKYLQDEMAEGDLTLNDFNSGSLLPPHTT